MVKPLKLLSITTLFIAIFSLPATAGGRYSNEQGFFLFDLFGSAPNSIYRQKSPKVRGFRRKVGGYSYKFSDVMTGYGNDPRDFSPVFDGGLYSNRLGIDGPYTGD